MLISKDSFYKGLIWLTFFSLLLMKWEPAPFDFLLLLLLAAAVAFGYFSRLQIRQFLPLTPVAFLALFIAANIISLSNCTDLSTGISFLLISLYCIFIWAFFLFLLKRFQLSGFFTAMSGYITAAVLSAILGIMVFLKLLPFRQMLFYSYRGCTYRVEVFFHDPNVFGAVMVPVVIAGLAVLLWRPKRIKFLWEAVFMLSFLAVVLSFSRAAVLNLAVSSLVVLSLYAYKREYFNWARVKSLLLGAAIIVFVLVLMYFLTDQHRFADLLINRTQLRPYDSVRFSNYLAAFKMAVQNPMGIGPGQAPLNLVQDTHNVYLKVFLENGVLGITAYAGLLLASLLQAGRLALNKQTHNRPVYICTFALLLGILANAIFIDTLHWRHFWILLAIPWTRFYLQPDRGERAQTAAARRNPQEEQLLHRIMMVITKGDLGGAQTHVYDLCSRLKEELDIHVVIGESGPLYDKLEAAGIAVHIIPSLNRDVSFIHDWQALRELTRLIQGLNPDLIAAHSSKAGILSRLAAARNGKPCVFTAHGWAFSEGVSPLKSRLYQMAESFAARRTDRIICVSEYDRLLAIKRKVAASEQLVTIHNGISLPEGKPETRRDQEEVRMIMVARFCEPKDHALLFQAVKSMQSRQSFRLQLVGDGPGFKKSKALVSQLGIDHLVEFLGPRQDVPALLQQADLFVLCSNWEGFPITILEAMRAGLPVVCSDVGGCSEAVVEGETGYLVPRGDLQRLIKRLTGLIENEPLRRQMGAAGYSRFAEHFTVDKMVQQTLLVYQEVMQQRNS